MLATSLPYARIHCGVDVILRRRYCCVGLSASLTTHHPALGDNMIKPPVDRNCDRDGRMRKTAMQVGRVTSCPLHRPTASPNQRDDFRVPLEQKRSKELPSHHAPTLHTTRTICLSVHPKSAQCARHDGPAAGLTLLPHDDRIGSSLPQHLECPR